jgi:hypothetical protein
MEKNFTPFNNINTVKNLSTVKLITNDPKFVAADTRVEKYLIRYMGIINFNNSINIYIYQPSGLSLSLIIIKIKSFMKSIISTYRPIIIWLLSKTANGSRHLHRHQHYQ